MSDTTTNRYALGGERRGLTSGRVSYCSISLTVIYPFSKAFATPCCLSSFLCGAGCLRLVLAISWRASFLPAARRRLSHNPQWGSGGHSDHRRSVFPVNSGSFAVEKGGLGVRRDRTAQPLMFLQNYLVDKCSIINLNPLAKRIHKYLNNGLFRVLPVYQTCHMFTFLHFSYC